MKNIILIGMPGCGKTTIGKRLARQLSLDFADCDAEIEKASDMTVSEIFKLYGEAHFRELETNMLKILSKKENIIISTGGGCIERTENIEILKNCGVVVFINRPLQDIQDGINISNRPLLSKDKDVLWELYERRLPLYKSACHIEISDRLYPNKMVKKIIDEVNIYNG